jgi:hypothetical protein
MKSLRKIFLCGAIPLLLAAGSAHAQGIGHSGMYVRPPNWDMMMEKLTPEQRSQAIDIQMKMMKMEMDYEQAKAQMEMKHAAEMMQMQTQLLQLYKGH